MSAASATLPLDALRAAALRSFARPLAPLLVGRELRVAVLATASALLSLALAWRCPHVLLVLSPLLLGVPHLVGDVRYLVLRPGLHRRPLLWAAVGLPLLLLTLPGTGVWPGLIAAAGALAVCRAGPQRKAAGLAVLAAVAAGAWMLGKAAGPVLAQLHNVLTLAVWWAWRPRHSRLHWIPLGLAAAGTAFLFLAPSGADSLDSFAGISFRRLAASLSPGAGYDVALSLAAVFAFTQALHYTAWVRLIPEEDRARPVPRSFRASLHALKTDFGAWPLSLCLALALGIAVWGLMDAASARDGYFRLSLFHGHLELGALALLWAEGRFGQKP